MLVHCQQEMLNFDIFSPFIIFSKYAESKIFKEIIKLLISHIHFPPFLHTRWRHWNLCRYEYIIACYSFSFQRISTISTTFSPNLQIFFKNQNPTTIARMASTFFSFDYIRLVFDLDFYDSHIILTRKVKDGSSWLNILPQELGQTSCIQFTHFHKQAFFSTPCNVGKFAYHFKFFKV